MFHLFFSEIVILEGGQPAYMAGAAAVGRLERRAGAATARRGARDHRSVYGRGRADAVLGVARARHRRGALLSPLRDSHSAKAGSMSPMRAARGVLYFIQFLGVSAAFLGSAVVSL